MKILDEILYIHQGKSGGTGQKLDIYLIVLDSLAKQRKNRMISKIEKHPELKSHIISMLCECKWSPEMITGRMKRMGNNRVIVSHETIYKYIYSPYGQKLGLYKHLMRKRPKRQLKCSRIHRRKIADRYNTKYDSYTFHLKFCKNRAHVLFVLLAAFFDKISFVQLRMGNSIR